MKVKELKQILEGVDENIRVCADYTFWNSEVNGYYLNAKGELMLTSLNVQPK